MCIHRWRIEEPEGLTSSGRCQLCGTSRTFNNMPPELTNADLKRLSIITRKSPDFQR